MMQSTLIPLVKIMSFSNDQYIQLSKLPARPGKKDVMDGLEELRIVLEGTGKSNGRNKVLALENHGDVAARLKELINDSDYAKMQNWYARASDGKTIKKPTKSTKSTWIMCRKP